VAKVTLSPTPENQTSQLPDASSLTGYGISEVGPEMSIPSFICFTFGYYRRREPNFYDCVTSGFRYVVPFRVDKCVSVATL
jgi:hypothetical protein